MDVHGTSHKCVFACAGKTPTWHGDSWLKHRFLGVMRLIQLLIWDHDRIIEKLQKFTPEGMVEVCWNYTYCTPGVRYLLCLTCVSPFPRWPHMESHDYRGPGAHESLAGLVRGLSGPVGLGWWCNWWCWRTPCVRSLQAWSRICHVLIQHPCFHDLLSLPMLS